MSTTGFKITPRFDPAIDAEAMGPEAVRSYRDGGDYSLLRFREEPAPVVFHCRRLRVSEMQAAKSGSTETDVFVECFRRGVMRVTGLYTEDASRRDWQRPDPDRPIAMKSIDADFDAGEVLEVGAAIYGRSILGKGRPAAWPQPDTSQLAVGALVRQLVEQTRAPAASPPPIKSEAEAQQQEIPAG